MKYTYRFDIQGGGSTHYIRFNFDRPLSGVYMNRIGILSERATPAQKELMNSVSKVKGVIVNNDSGNEWTGGELIVMEGNELLVKVAKVDAKDVPELAKTIVKRVQRRIAKGETRRRITHKELMDGAAKLNAKTWGAE